MLHPTTANHMRAVKSSPLVHELEIEAQAPGSDPKLSWRSGQKRLHMHMVSESL